MLDVAPPLAAVLDAPVDLDDPLRREEHSLAVRRAAFDHHSTLAWRSALASRAGDYVVFDPTGQQAIPAYTNAQKLGIGAPVLVDIVRKVIKVRKQQPLPPRIPEKKDPKTDPGKADETKM